MPLCVVKSVTIRSSAKRADIHAAELQQVITPANDGVDSRSAPNGVYSTIVRRHYALLDEAVGVRMHECRFKGEQGDRE